MQKMKANPHYYFCMSLHSVLLWSSETLINIAFFTRSVIEMHSSCNSGRWCDVVYIGIVGDK